MPGPLELGRQTGWCPNFLQQSSDESLNGYLKLHFSALSLPRCPPTPPHGRRPRAPASNPMPSVASGCFMGTVPPSGRQENHLGCGERTYYNLRGLKSGAPGWLRKPCRTGAFRERDGGNCRSPCLCGGHPCSLMITATNPLPWP